MKGKSVVTHTIRQNEIPALFERWVTNHLSKSCAHEKKLLLLTF
jgi:hypothetical protein